MFSLLLAISLSQLPAAPIVEAAPPATTDVTAEATPTGLRFLKQVNGQPQEVSALPVGAVKDFIRRGSTVYAALQAGGVVVVDLQLPASPVITARLSIGQPVDQLAGTEDVLVLELPNREVQSFSVADPLHPVPAQFHVAASGTPFGGKGQVLLVKDARVVIQGGSEAGFRVGEHVKILSRAALSAAELLAEQNGLTSTGTATAVVVLERVDRDKSVASLGRGDSAQVGDRVEGTADPLSESLATPRAIPFNWRIAGELRPFLDVSNSGQHAVGLLTEMMVDYYFTGVPLKLQAGFEPIGLVAGGSAQHNPVVGVVDLAFASPFFELGLGTGFSVLASESFCPPLTACSNGNDEVDPLVVGTLRLGAIDGLDLVGSFSVAFTRNGSVLRSAEVTTNLPVARRLTLFLTGAGGSGFAFGEVGARTYLNGLGGPGTVILSGGLGGAAISDTSAETVAGPSMTLGVEVRL